MTIREMFWRGVLPLSLSLTVTCACVFEHHCTEMACQSEIRVTADVPAEIEALTGELCVNDHCSQLMLAQGSGSCSEAFSQDRACLSEPEQGTRRVTIFRALHDITPRDGDRYRLRLTDARTGNLLIEGMNTVNYQRFYPNGPDCPGVCYSGAVHFSSLK